MEREEFRALLDKVSKPKVKKVPSKDEQNIQIACVNWFTLQYKGIANMLIHIPNEGFKNGKVAGGIRKAMGVRAGFPDLFLAIPNNGYHGLFIEMKTEKKTSRMRENQKVYQELLTERGYAHSVCRSLHEFMDAVNRYLWIECK